MTTTNDPDTLAAVRDSVILAERVASRFSRRSSRVDLNSVEHIGTAALTTISAGDLTSLIAHGHLVDVRVRTTGWLLHLRRGGGDGDVTETDGPIAEAIQQGQIDDLEAAILGRDFADIIGLLQEHDAEVTLRVINDPDATGTHWIATHTEIREILQASRWVPLARQLATGPTGLLVDDLGDAVLTNQAFTVYGPNGDPAMIGSLDPERRDPACATDEAFRLARAVQSKPYPSPTLFAPLILAAGVPSTTTENTLSAFNSVTFLLAWALLANTSNPVDGGIHINVSGARELDIDVRPAANPDTDVLLDLYRWVATSAEVDRLYFAQQALTLAIVTADDVQTAAEPALRTAKSLYDLSRRSSVAEVMAARRSAREIALAASRSAATQAREAAAKAVERTVLQVAAAAGIIVARLQQALPIDVTIGLLALIVAICMASAVVTDFVALHSARGGLDSELKDLDRYRDSLSQSDVDDAKRVGAVTAARSDLTRARVTIWTTYGIAIVTVLIVILLLVSNGRAEGDDESPSSPATPTSTATDSSSPNSERSKTPTLPPPSSTP